MPETNVALTASGRDSVPETNVIICFVNLVLMMLFYFQLNKSSDFKRRLITAELESQTARESAGL